MASTDPLHQDLLSFCRHQLGHHEQAVEVARRALADHDPADGPVPLFAAALQACREQPWVAGPLQTAGLGDAVVRRPDVRALLEGLARLGEDQRAALLLCEVGALRTAEAAEVLGVRRAQLRRLIFCAREALAPDELQGGGCRPIRAELGVARGAALRTGRLRRHPATCPPCAAWAAEVRRQRAALAVALPVDAGGPSVRSGPSLVALGGALPRRRLAAAAVTVVAGLAGYAGVATAVGGHPEPASAEAQATQRHR